MTNEESRSQKIAIGAITFFLGCSPYFYGIFQWASAEPQNSSILCFVYTLIIQFLQIKRKIPQDTFDVSNHESATLFWITFFIIWALTQEKIREATLKVLKSFLSRQVLTWTTLMFLYVSLEIVLYSGIGFWKLSNLKDTIYWVIGTAFVLLIKSANSSEKKGFFKDKIKDSIQYGVLLEFVVGLYSFSFLMELLLVPAIIIFSILDIFVGVRPEYAKDEYKPTKRAIKFIIIALGFTLFLHSLIFAIQNLNRFENIKILRDLLIIPALTIGYIPFIYLEALIMKYHRVFSVLNFHMQSNPQFIPKVQLQILKTCNIKIENLKIVHRNLHRFNSIENASQIKIAMKKIFAPPKPIFPTKYSIVGQWCTNDAYVRGHINYGIRTDYFFTQDKMRQFSKLPSGGSIDDTQNYKLSSIDENKRLVKLITYWNNGEISLENALKISEDGKEIMSSFLDEDSDVTDFSNYQTWKYVGINP